MIQYILGVLEDGSSISICGVYDSLEKVFMDIEGKMDSSTALICTVDTEGNAEGRFRWEFASEFDDRRGSCKNDTMLIDVKVPGGIPDLEPRVYDLDYYIDHEKLRHVNLWESLIYLEPGQRIIFECIKRVDEGKELGPDGEYVTYSNQKLENQEKTVKNVTEGKE